MIGRKKSSEIRAELEAALSGPASPLVGSRPADGASGGEVVESLRRFLATKREGEDAREAEKGAEAPAS